MAVRIITDSTCDLPLDKALAMGVEIIPLKVSFGEEEYIDKYTISNEEFYEKLSQSKVMPTTTLINPQQVLDVLNKYKDDDIVGVFISKKLSGSFQSAMVAKEASDRNNVYFVDSNTVTIGLALLVEMAVAYRDQGLSAKEIYERLMDLSKRVLVFGVIDTLKYLVAGGRLTGVQGVLGGILGIKPVIKVTDGEVVNIGKERGTKKALNFMLSAVEQAGEADAQLPVAYGHAGNPEDLQDLIEKFGRQGSIYSVGSVVGAHAGPGIIAVAYFKK